MKQKCEECDGWGTLDAESACDKCSGSGVNPGFVAPTNCPMCNAKISYAECETTRPFTAYSPMEGLNAWGAADMPKEAVCYSGGEYIHFRTPTEERLVRMTGIK